jgi:hypothetical protein
MFSDPNPNPETLAAGLSTADQPVPALPSELRLDSGAAITVEPAPAAPVEAATPSGQTVDAPAAPAEPATPPAQPLEAVVSGLTGLAHKLEQWARKLPGVGGYMDREVRRDSDHVLRAQLAERTEAAIGQLSAVQRTLVDTLQLDLVDDVERLVVKLRKFTDGIRTAAAGYAGAFNQQAIGEPELEKLYDYDLHLLTNVETIEKAIAELQNTLAAGGAGDLSKLNIAAGELVTAFENRKNLLQHGLH